MTVQQLTNINLGANNQSAEPIKYDKKKNFISNQSIIEVIGLEKK